MARVAKGLLIFGGGGHGKVVADLARSCMYELLGYIDADERKLGQIVEPGGARVVALEQQLLDTLSESGELPLGASVAVSAVGDNAVRLRHIEILGDLAAPALVHPSAVCSPSATIGAGTVVFALVAINASAAIGRGVILNTGSIIEHDCTVADAAHVSPGAVLAGGVSVGARTWIGAGATVIQGVRIGADVMVGAGAVVIRDVPDGSRVAGVPARPL